MAANANTLSYHMNKTVAATINSGVFAIQTFLHKLDPFVISHPVTTMRTKKNARDKLHTEAFFGQSSACPCTHCHGSSQAHCDPMAGTEMTSAEISRKISSATKTLQAAIEVGSSSLTEEGDGQNEMAQPENLGTFELVELDQCLIDYEEVLDELASDEESTRASIREKVTAVWNNDRHPTKIFATLLDIFDLKQQHANAITNSCLYMAQFLNADKKFRSMIEAFQEVAHKYEARHGQGSQPLAPLSLNQYFDDPIALSMREVQKKKKPRPGKRLCMEEAAALTRRLCMLAIRDVQIVNKSISDDRHSSALAFDVATTSSRIREDTPEYIRQALCDFEFVYDEIANSRDEIIRMRDHLRCTIMAWVNTGREAWEYGKTHLHDFPNMRRYEYLRVSLIALYTVFLRIETKIVRYYAGHGDPKSIDLTPRLEKALRTRILTSEEAERDWEEKIRKLKAFAISVDDMIQRHEQLEEELDLQIDHSGDEWWKVFVPTHKKS